MMNYSAIISTPVGRLGIITSDMHLLKIDFLETSSPDIKPTENGLTQQIVAQLIEYFSRNSQHIFDLPIHLTGTKLQLKIWSRLRRIPAGNTVTYSELADEAKTHPRVIGNICRANPIPIVIPCHRVVAKNSLGGFCGKTNGRWLTIKQQLLEHEGWKAF